MKAAAGVSGRDKHPPRVRLIQTMMTEHGGTKAGVSRQQLLGPVMERPVCFGGQRRAAGQCQRI